MQGGGGRKAQGQAGPSEHSLAECQARSVRRVTQMLTTRGSREGNAAGLHRHKVNPRQILIIVTPSGHNVPLWLQDINGLNTLSLLYV